MGEKREDDGVVTSAPASSVGSLLTDLLSEAKKDVAAERQQLESQLSQRENAAREQRARDEARKREALQQKLVEETRLRNQALAGAKRDMASERIAAATAPHQRPKLVEPDAVSVSLAPAQAPKRRGVPILLAAAMVFVGIGLGVGGAFALTPPQRLNLPDINTAARAIVEQTAKAALAEGEIAQALTNANDRIKALETKMETAIAEQKKLADAFEATKTELAEAKAQLEADGGKKPNGHRPGSRPGNGSSGGNPVIDTTIFK
ncbi:MAG: hypothetical protein EP329_25035 [Deltaproteobacteria bacterium]|nr:MAG: hypothetical protein EP329_25035 [Deltaproteobacteria bacterium]